MSRTVSIRFGNDGKIKKITRGASPALRKLAARMERDNLAGAKKAKPLATMILDDGELSAVSVWSDQDDSAVFVSKDRIDQLISELQEIRRAWP